MAGAKKDCCSICRLKKLRLFSPHEHIVEKELLVVIENISGVRMRDLKPPPELLMCAECAVALIQAEIIVVKLQRALATQCRKHIGDDSNVAQNNKRMKLESTECLEDELENEKPKPVEDHLASTTKSEWQFKCEFCTYETKNAKVFKRHLLSKHQSDNPRIYKCNFCPETYQRLYALHNHIAYVHENKSRPLQRRKSVAADLSSHGNLELSGDYSITETNEDTGIGTPEKVTFNKSLDTTMISSGLNTYHFECDQCKYETENAKLFKRHLLLKHHIEKPRIYECKQCSSSYQRLYALRNHVAFVHEKKPRPTPARRKSVPPDFDTALFDETFDTNAIECSGGNKVSEEQNDGGNIQQVSSNTFKCKLCSYKGDNAKHLQKHLYVMHQLDTLEQDKVDPSVDVKREKNKSKTEHASSKESKPLLKPKSDWVFLCEYCDFETNKKKQYKSHLSSKHQTDNDCIYKCEYCSASFERYPRLESHVEGVHNAATETVPEYSLLVAEQTNGLNRNFVNDDSELRCHYSDCNKHFSKLTKLRQHLIKKHANTSFAGEEFSS